MHTNKNEFDRPGYPQLNIYITKEVKGKAKGIYLKGSKWKSMWKK